MNGVFNVLKRISVRGDGNIKEKSDYAAVRGDDSNSVIRIVVTKR